MTEQRNPEYESFAPSWKLMRDAMAGEDQIKAAGEDYLPMKTGTKLISDARLRSMTYDMYKERAEFPDLVALTVRGSLGVAATRPVSFGVPEALKEMVERTTPGGHGLEGLYRQILEELHITGRFGLLPVVVDGVPKIMAYRAERILDWEKNEDGHANYVLLDETRWVRSENGERVEEKRLRELVVDETGYYGVLKTMSGGEWAEGEREYFTGAEPPTYVPFVFINVSDLSPDPDDVPLYGLAKICRRIYRLDADYGHALHMTSEPTPYVTGMTEAAIKSGMAPTTLGSSVIWYLPQGASAGYVEFSGAGVDKIAAAIAASYDRAVAFGAQMLSSDGGGQSGDAIRLRLGSQTATLRSLVVNAAAGLETAVRFLASWTRSSEEVSITPDIDFFAGSMTPAEAKTLVEGWLAGGYSWPTLVHNLRRGGIVPDHITDAEEIARMNEGPETET
jgi:hypothetical protein